MTRRRHPRSPPNPVSSLQKMLSVLPGWGQPFVTPWQLCSGCRGAPPLQPGRALLLWRQKGFGWQCLCWGGQLSPRQHWFDRRNSALPAGSLQKPGGTQAAHSSSSESSDEEEDAVSQVWYLSRLEPLWSCSWLLNRTERDSILRHCRQGAGWVCQQRNGGSPVQWCEQDLLVGAEREREAFAPGMFPQAARPWVQGSGCLPWEKRQEEVVPCKG